MLKNQDHLWYPCADRTCCGHWSGEVNWISFVFLKKRTDGRGGKGESNTLDGNNPPTKVPFSTDIKNPPELRSPQNLIMEGRRRSLETTQTLKIHILSIPHKSLTLKVTAHVSLMNNHEDPSAKALGWSLSPPASSNILKSLISHFSIWIGWPYKLPSKLGHHESER